MLYDAGGMKEGGGVERQHVWRAKTENNGEMKTHSGSVEQQTGKEKKRREKKRRQIRDGKQSGRFFRDGTLTEMTSRFDVE